MKGDGGTVEVIFPFSSLGHRDWLAGLAMPSVIHTNDSCEDDKAVDMERLAWICYRYADAMIAEGRKEHNQNRRGYLIQPDRLAYNYGYRFQHHRNPLNGIA